MCNSATQGRTCVEDAEPWGGAVADKASRLAPQAVAEVTSGKDERARRRKGRKGAWCCYDVPSRRSCSALGLWPRGDARVKWWLVRGRRTRLDWPGPIDILLWKGWRLIVLAYYNPLDETPHVAAITFYCYNYKRVSRVRTLKSWKNVCLWLRFNMKNIMICKIISGALLICGD